MGESQEGQPQSQTANKKGVPRLLQTEPWTDKLLRLLPEWTRDLVQDRRRQLLYVERRIQRRLLNEFRSQARELEPVLRTRGQLVGTAVLDAFTGSTATTVTYADVAASNLQDTAAGKLPVRELMAVIDPLITPFITPFVEGLKTPINQKISEIETTVKQSFVATGVVCLVGGFLLGRYVGGGGGGGQGGRQR